MKQEIQVDREHRFTDNPLRHVVQCGGLELACYEWPGEGDPIFMEHATGFHSQCWREVIRYLPGRHIFAMDMPSHGASAHAQPPYDPTEWGLLLSQAIESLDLCKLLGVGHSLGGHLMVQAASKLSVRFGGLVLIDPVIVAPELSLAFRGRVSADQHPVSRRRNRWESWQQMFEHFSLRNPYSNWEPAVLRDYCRFGLVESADGEGFELACPPLLEASVYSGIHMEDIYHAVAEVHLPVDIIRARSRRHDDPPFDFSPSPTWEPLVEHFSNATDLQLGDRSHFIPMEIPRWTAERIATLWASLH